MALKNPASGGSWTTLSLASGLVATGSPFLIPAYRKDSFGIVYLRGTASYVSGAISTICTLPSGFRPTAIARFIVFATDGSSSASTGFLDMETSGNLTYSGGSYAALSFDQISFATY